jgi:hypothetical protein
LKIVSHTRSDPELSPIFSVKYHPISKLDLNGKNLRIEYEYVIWRLL